MTLPHERRRALWLTREFLLELCDREHTPGVPDAVRLKARRMLRHYPEDAVLDILAARVPEWLGRDEG